MSVRGRVITAQGNDGNFGEMCIQNLRALFICRGKTALIEREDMDARHAQYGGDVRQRPCDRRRGVLKCDGDIARSARAKEDKCAEEKTIALQRGSFCTIEPKRLLARTKTRMTCLRESSTWRSQMKDFDHTVMSQA